MSNLWCNIRLGLYHLQIGEPKRWSLRISRNDCHIDNPVWFQIHYLLGFQIKISGPDFVWYDVWIGLYYDVKKRILYFCPFFCIVIKVEF